MKTPRSMDRGAGHPEQVSAADGVADHAKRSQPLAATPGRHIGPTDAHEPPDDSPSRSRGLGGAKGSTKTCRGHAAAQQRSSSRCLFVTQVVPFFKTVFAAVSKPGFSTEIQLPSWSTGQPGTRCVSVGRLPRSTDWSLARWARWLRSGPSASLHLLGLAAIARVTGVSDRWQPQEPSWGE